MMTPSTLSRRERQIMDALYALGRASVAQVRERMPDPPGYSAVRAFLRILEEKGHVRHEEDGPRYVYLPVVPARRAQRAAVSHLVRTFFQGSAERTMAALIESADTKLSHDELDRIEQLVIRARKKGK
ncbi:MAG: BlaI/MecI/CopY family transcriptional regulator [Candidatus Eiseniibacteriota bacterium]